MPRETEPITQTPQDRGVEETHPAFGMAVVTRSSGTSRPLFQSDLTHRETMNLSIHTASRSRDLNSDWVHAEDQIIEVEMSLAQWGQLVSSVGLGSGTPVTIRHLPGRHLVPDLPYEPRIQKNLDEVDGTVDKLLERIARDLAVLTEVIENKRGVKATREALRNLSSSVANAKSNTGFAVKTLTEAAEQVLSQTRADIEAQVLQATRTQGLSIEQVPQHPLDEITAEIEQSSNNPEGGE